MDHKIYHKILTGEASEKEAEAFYLELEQSPDKKDEFIRLKKLWDINRINHINVSAERKGLLFNNFWKEVQLRKNKGQQKLYLQWAKIAAIVVLALLGGYHLNSLTNQSSDSWKQFHSENGSISSVLLEDGSKILLNANSTLSLNENGKEVTVQLKGEAFFEIKHDKNRTFIVDLGKIKIHDLGTSFNVSAYPNEKYFRTTLTEGGLAVLDYNGSEIKELKVNQTFRYDQTKGTYKLEKLDPVLVTGWTENKFVFIDKPLTEICTEIGKWYGVSIIIRDKSLEDGKYTSVIRRPSTVKQLLDMFNLTTGINYKIDDQNDKQTIIYLNK